MRKFLNARGDYGGGDDGIGLGAAGLVEGLRLALQLVSVADPERETGPSPP